VNPVLQPGARSVFVFAAELARQLSRPLQWFGHANATSLSNDDLTRGLGRRHPSCVRHDGVGSRQRADEKADEGVVDADRSPVAAARARLDGDADIWALGDSDGGEAERRAELEGQTRSSDVIAPRCVDDDDVRVLR
jgi:hypothetical protein